MNEYSLRGHHVKNLRMALLSRNHNNPIARLYYDQGQSYDTIFKNPEANVRIMAGAIDHICSECDRLNFCLNTGGVTTERDRIYDEVRASYTRIGETYRAADLFEKLLQQSEWKQFPREIFS